jgi:type IV pilus assembly protein PilP
MIRPASGITLALPWVMLVILSGCSPEHRDIQQWVNQRRQAATPRVMPIAKPVAFVPVTYTQSSTADPFEENRLTDVLKTQDSGHDALLQTELNRRKEPLEAVALDTMAMVGSIDKNRQQVALIKANNLIYQIRVGNYLGHDYGKVTKITENTIELREIVQDASGLWVERNATIRLQHAQEQ